MKIPEKMKAAAIDAFGPPSSITRTGITLAD